MGLTRSFRETVVKHVQEAPAFRAALARLDRVRPFPLLGAHPQTPGHHPNLPPRDQAEGDIPTWG